MVEKVRQSADWATDASVAESLNALRSVATLKGGRVEQADDSRFTAHFGSKLAYRMWGAFLKRGKRAVPFTVSVKATASTDGGAHIAAEGESDEGPLIVYRIEPSTRLLGERISDVLSALRADSERRGS